MHTVRETALQAEAVFADKGFMTVLHTFGGSVQSKVGMYYVNVHAQGQRRVRPFATACPELARSVIEVIAQVNKPRYGLYFFPRSARTLGVEGTWRKARERWRR